MEELAALDGRLSAESRNFVIDQERVAELGIERIPAIAVLGETQDYGVRFYGLPTGYEFGSLVEAILDVSRGIERPLRRNARGASRRSTRTCACGSSRPPPDRTAPGRSAWPSSSRSRART